MPRIRHIYVIYIYQPLDNRYGFSLSIGNTKNHVATLTYCLEWLLKYVNISIILAPKVTSHACILLIDNVGNYLYLNNGRFKFEVDPHQFNLRLYHFSQFQHQSINQSNPILLKERVSIPRTRCAGGAAMLWGALLLDGVGSCRLFFTDDLHKPHTFKSCFTHSSQVFFGRPRPFLPGTGRDLTLFISPLERMTCPNHLSRRSRTRTARSHIPSFACRSSIDGSSDGLTPQIQGIIARSLRHSRWRASEVMGQVSVPCKIELRTLELNRWPLRSKGTGLDVCKGRFSRNLPQAHLHLAVAAAIQPPPALSMSPR